MALNKGVRNNNTKNTTSAVKTVAKSATPKTAVNTQPKTVQPQSKSATANTAQNVNPTVKTAAASTVQNKSTTPVETRPYSSPNYPQSTPTVSTPVASTPTASTSNSTRPYSTPNFNYVVQGGNGAYSFVPTTSGKGINYDALKNAAPVVSTPTVTAPTVTTPKATPAATSSNSGLNVGTTNNALNVAPATSGAMIGTALNPGNIITTAVERAIAEQNQQTLDNHALDQMTARANENPTDTTQRYLNLLSSVTGANGTSSRPYSNPNFSFNTSNNGSTRVSNRTLDDIIDESVYNSLVGEVGSSAPFVEVPAYNLNNAGLAINGPTAVVQNPGPTIGETMNDYISRRLGELGLTPVTDNPLEAAMTGTAFGPFEAAMNDPAFNPNATSSTKSSFNGDISNKYSADNFGNGGNGGNGGDGYGYGYGGGSDGRDGLDGLNIGGNGYDLSALYDLLNQQINEYNLEYNNLMNSLMSAYGLNNQNLDNYYQSVLDSLANNYADTENLLNSQLSGSQQELEDARRRELQEAYIARMMQEKSLRDQLDAYGLSGGTSESVMADLRNNYMNNRANVEERTQNSLKNLLQTYLGNMSDARQRYNQNLMNAQQNRLNAQQNYANNLAESQANAASYLANARSGAYQNLFNTLAKLYTA